MRRTRHVASGLLLWAALGAPNAGAQQVAPPPNARLRLTLAPEANAPPRRVIGWLESFDNATITLRDVRGRMSTTERRVVNRAEQSQGRHSRWRRVGIGFAAGFGGGALVGLAAGEDCSNAYGFGPCFSPGTTAALLGMFFGGIGAGVGAVLQPGERWMATSFPGQTIRSGP